MKVPILTILNAVSILEKLDTTTMKLSAAYKVNKVLEEAKEAISGFEARRLNVADEHGELSEDGKQYMFETDESKAAFNSAVEELLNDEIDIEVAKIPLELLDGVFDVSPQHLPFVVWFIDGLE